MQLSIDRYEGEKSEFAVLVTEDGRQINFPRDLLPKGAKPGELLSLTLERDVAGTRKMKAETKQVQDEMKKQDPGETSSYETDRRMVRRRPRRDLIARPRNPESERRGRPSRDGEPGTDYVARLKKGDLAVPSAVFGADGPSQAGRRRASGGEARGQPAPPPGRRPTRAFAGPEAPATSPRPWADSRRGHTGTLVIRSREQGFPAPPGVNENDWSGQP
jgi:hypothetical protein